MLLAKTLRSFFSTATLAAVLAGCVTTLAPDVPQNYTYMSQNGAVTITKYVGPGGAIYIPRAIDGLPVTGIGEQAFYFCTNLTRVTLPDTVTHIGERAFNFCPALTDISLPNSVVSIERCAFQECTGLTDVRLPASVTNLGVGVFVGCRNLDSITVDRNNAVYCSENGVVFSKDKRTLVQYPCGRAGDYVIPGRVTHFGICAFSECRKLTGVTLPDGITAIPCGMFQKNNKLTRIVIPNSVTNIGEAAFYCCYSLTHIVLPASVAYIQRDAFNTCRVLSGVYVQGDAPGFRPSLFDNTDQVTIYYMAGTKGWGETFDGRPTATWNPQQPPFDATHGTPASKWYFSTPLAPNR